MSRSRTHTEKQYARGFTEKPCELGFTEKPCTLGFTEKPCTLGFQTELIHGSPMGQANPFSRQTIPRVWFGTRKI